jgi:hypothetical protein
MVMLKHDAAMSDSSTSSSDYGAIDSFTSTSSASSDPPRKRRYSKELLEAIADGGPKSGSFASSVSPLLAAEWKAMAADLGLIIGQPALPPPLLQPPAATKKRPEDTNFVISNIVGQHDPTEAVVHKQHTELQRRLRAVLQRDENLRAQHILADALSSRDPRRTLDCLLHLTPSQLDVLDADAKDMVRGLVNRVHERQRLVESGKPAPRATPSPA